MSWDIFVQDFPDVARVEDIPDDFKPLPLGSRGEIVAKIVDAVPTADFSDPSWGRIDGHGYSIEVNIGRDEMCNSFALHVRGSGDEVVTVVDQILASVGVRAIADGEFFSADQARANFKAWQNYRDEVTGDQPSG